MTTTTTLLRVLSPMPVAEPRGSIAVARVTDGFLQLFRVINAAAKAVANSSRRSRVSWRE